MHEVAPVANSGSDEVEVSRQGGPVADVRRQQDQIIIRWAELWRMIILSSLDLTAYPYCRYIRVLDLRNLKDLLDEPKFNRGAASKYVFQHRVRFCFLRTINGCGSIGNSSLAN